MHQNSNQTAFLGKQLLLILILIKHAHIYMTNISFSQTLAVNTRALSPLTLTLTSRVATLPIQAERGQKTTQTMSKLTCDALWVNAV